MAFVREPFWRKLNFSGIKLGRGPKSFTERNPKIIGAIAIVVILAVTAGAIGLNSDIVKNRYPITASFADTAGMQSGDSVLLAGVVVGQVNSVSLNGNRANVGMQINHGVQIPADSTADVYVETLLGKKDIRINPGHDFSHLMGSGGHISKTTTPTELLDLQNESAPRLEQADATSLNKLIEDLAAVTQGKQAEVSTIADGLNRFLGTVNQRSGTVGNLIDSAKTVTSTLANRDQQLVSIVGNLGIVVNGLAQRKDALSNLLIQSEQMAAQTSALVGANRGKLDAILAELHTDLGIVGRHQNDLAEAVADLGDTVQAYSSIGVSGPNNAPNPSWANTFLQTPGGLGEDAIFGSCGDFDQALTAILGPDPAEHPHGAFQCTPQPATGPVPGGGPFPSSSSSSSSGAPPAPPSGGGIPAAGGSSTSGPGANAQSLQDIVGPVVGGH
ncbi:MAG TPA: MCE family protein [Acidimicrobiales bacterium]|nr:MCE family protein [Acidimicrobiales bacterium]